MSSPEATVDLADLPVGRMRVIELRGREVVLCRTREGVFAVDNVCTHAEARMCEGALKGTRIVCPLHGAAFSVIDGNVLGGPATSPLGVYAVRVVDGRAQVSASPSSSVSSS